MSKDYRALAVAMIIVHDSMVQHEPVAGSFAYRVEVHSGFSFWRAGGHRHCACDGFQAIKAAHRSGEFAESGK